MGYYIGKYWENENDYLTKCLICPRGNGYARINDTVYVRQLLGIGRGSTIIEFSYRIGRTTVSNII